MTSTAPTRDGNGGQDGGIAMSRRSVDLDAPVDDPPRSAADRWAAAGYTSAAAVADWTAIGIDTPEIARQWGQAGFTAESAARWVQVPDMTPAEAATCANGGLTPTDVQRIRRADPGWARPEPEAPAPELGHGIDL
jgi:hypothetical protein